MKKRFIQIFSKKEIITYKNYNDLVEKILKYKKDDKNRRLIANGKKNI